MGCYAHHGWLKCRQEPSSPIRVNSQDRVSGSLCCALVGMAGLGPSLKEYYWTASSRGMILFGVFFKSHSLKMDLSICITIGELDVTNKHRNHVSIISYQREGN